jgi:transcriptional regulator with XRE-family HTH domain
MEKEEIMALIIKIRKKKKISQREMAEQLNISTRQYNLYENLKTIMNIEIFSNILKILEIDMKDFVLLKSSTVKKKPVITKTDLNKIQTLVEKLKSKLDK